jgi:hypothetical protein
VTVEDVSEAVPIAERSDPTHGPRPLSPRRAYEHSGVRCGLKSDAGRHRGGVRLLTGGLEELKQDIFGEPLIRLARRSGALYLP